jgi:hypothetical protein
VTARADGSAIAKRYVTARRCWMVDRRQKLDN